MSNLWFNIRFGKRHLQLSRDWELSWTINSYWHHHKPDRWFEIYCAFGRHYQ